MGAWPVYYVWPMPSYFIFESPDNWLNTHKADWCWPIIILLIGHDGQSRGQRELAGGVLDFTHRIPTPQCTLGFVKWDYWGSAPMDFTHIFAIGLVPWMSCPEGGFTRHINLQEQIIQPQQNKAQLQCTIWVFQRTILQRWLRWNDVTGAGANIEPGHLA